MGVTITRAAAPYGSGIATGREFTDGRKAMVYKVKDTFRGRVVALKFHPNKVFELQGGGYEACEIDFR